MDYKIFDSTDELAIYCADIFTGLLTTKPRCVLGLATGASPVKTYKELIRRYQEGKISFADVTTFNLDEYCDLPKNDKNSYYTFMNEKLFDFIDIKEDNVHLMDGNAADADQEAAAFDAMIDRAGGIDIQLLGVGRNGHIGFNEPADHFSDGSFKVKLKQSTIDANSIYFDENPMPRYALTMGIGTIMKAKKIVLIATGDKKAEAIRAAIKGEVTPRCPVSILQTHPDALLLLDKEAASLL
ncbi:MAG: glucosamine-6-phosphate deaminase [Clostridia bacterium]|nr:glucosamine-6-phosphate deaminase [Clostridia bacterium]